MLDFHQEYPLPNRYTQEDGRRRYAYVTFVMRNDSYIPGALVLAYALRKLNVQSDLVCMVTKDISDISRSTLEILFDKTIEVDEIYLHHKRRQQRQDRPYLFTRFQALRAGPDGDMGCKYEKIVLLDADIFPLRNYDHLFSLETPAGIINESKTNCMEYDSMGRYIIPPQTEISGKWNWHEHYGAICPHGESIPQAITDRVLIDANNMGVNSSLWVLKPSMREYQSILDDIIKPEILERVSNYFNWPEMQYATIHWSGLWKSIDLRFASFNGYPQLSLLCGTHFAGYKPWNFKRIGTITRFSRFPDYALWHKMFLEMMEMNNSLQMNKKLMTLAGQIKQMIGSL